MLLYSVMFLYCIIFSCAVLYCIVVYSINFSRERERETERDRDRDRGRDTVCFFGLNVFKRMVCSKAFRRFCSGHFARLQRRSLFVGLLWELWCTVRGWPRAWSAGVI